MLESTIARLQVCSLQLTPKYVREEESIATYKLQLLSCHDKLCCISPQEEFAPSATADCSIQQTLVASSQHSLYAWKSFLCMSLSTQSFASRVPNVLCIIFLCHAPQDIMVLVAINLYSLYMAHNCCYPSGVTIANNSSSIPARRVLGTDRWLQRAASRRV